MPCLTKAELLKPQALKSEKFSLSSWGFGADDYVMIRELTSRDIVELSGEHGKELQDSSIESMTHVVKLGMVDDSGQCLCPDEQGVKDLLGLNVMLLKAIAEKIIDLTGLDTDPKN